LRLSVTPLVIGFLVTTTLMLVLRPVAAQLGLVDVPGGRKTHEGDVPIVGGIAIYLGLMGAVLAMGVSTAGQAALLVAAALMVVVGALDDRFDLAPYARILAHIAAAVTLVLASGYTVESLGDLLGLGAIDLGPGAFLFTVVACIALINGFNMLDGLDGLAGGVGLVALIGLSVFFLGAGAEASSIVSLAMAGAIGAFLVFNLPARFNRSVLAFMGDAGSTLLGFVLAGLSLIAIQPTAVEPRFVALPPVVVLWLMPVPIIELFTSTFRRAITGLSPLQADRGHFHHRLIEAGFSVGAVFLTYLVLSLLSAAAGTWMWYRGAGDSTLFFAFLGLTAAWLLFVHHARRWAGLLPQSLKGDGLVALGSVRSAD
jgi:UDP-GlcNAc:undecaprenyl-phosphate GlcNAc-1-phosphate transferase